MEDRYVDKLLATVAELAAVRPVERLATDTLCLLPGLIPGISYSWNEVDRVTGSLKGYFEPNSRFEGGEQAWMEHVGSHPVITYYNATNDGRPYAISDFLSMEEYHQTGIYQYFYRHLDTEDQLSFILPHPRVLLGIAINRAQPDFSRLEHRLANLLRPFLVQAYRNSIAFDRSQLLLEHINRRLASEGEGLLICSPSGVVVERTPGAVGLIDRWFGPTPARGLPAPIADWLDKGNEPGPPAPLVIDRGEHRLIIRRLPHSDGTTTVMLVEPPPGRAHSALRNVGLTGREAEVVCVMIEGSTNADIASHLGISYRTVDKHLQRAYDKLGVENRTAAANLVRQLETAAPF
jgi:DNA-binding CsgD family transcriptional regulator